MPKIDICMPTYRPNKAYLYKAIESLLQQTEQDWELWINDEPTDVDTKALLEPYTHDPRIHVSQNKERLGIGPNWNQTISLGEAPVLQFLFQDDVWDPHLLATGLQTLHNHSDVNIVFFNRRYQFEGSRPPRYGEIKEAQKEYLSNGKHNSVNFLRTWASKGLWLNILGEPPFVMMRRSLVEEVGPCSTDMKQLLDMEYWIRCLLKTDFYYVEQESGAFRIHTSAASFANAGTGLAACERFACFNILLASDCFKNEQSALRKHRVSGFVHAFMHRPPPADGGTKQDRKTAKKKLLRNLCNFVCKHPLFTAQCGLLYCKKRYLVDI